MKHILIMFPFLALVAVEAFGGEAPAPEKNLFHPSRLQTIDGKLTHYTQFAGMNVCAGCHTEMAEAWRSSMHAAAHLDPLYLGISKAAGAATQGLTDKFCAGCHTPLAVAGGEVPPVGNPLMSRIGVEGVTCDFCHLVDRSTGTGNLPAVLDTGPLKRGPRQDASSPFHKSRYLELSTQAEFCGMCHDVSHPLNNLPIENTYSEWKASPYNAADPAQRVYCQDCHLRQRPGMPSTGSTERPRYRAKTALMSPWRDDVFSHYFIGANTAFPHLEGHALRRRLAEERLRAAAGLDIINLSAAAGSLTFTVRVSNDGAGHYLPTGLTEMRQMWLETEVSTPDGAVLFSSGRLNDAGDIDPKAPLFHTVLGDAGGKPTLKVWEAATILHDRRIPPRRHDDSPYSVPFDKRKHKRLIIRVRLLYRSFPPQAALMGMGPEAAYPEPVVMTVAEKDVAAE